LQEIAGLV